MLLARRYAEMYSGVLVGAPNDLLGLPEDCSNANVLVQNRATENL
jgi:hypothetical protein